MIKGENRMPLETFKRINVKNLKIESSSEEKSFGPFNPEKEFSRKDLAVIKDFIEAECRLGYEEIQDPSKLYSMAFDLIRAKMLFPSLRLVLEPKLLEKMSEFIKSGNAGDGLYLFGLSLKWFAPKIFALPGVQKELQKNQEVFIKEFLNRKGAPKRAMISFLCLFPELVPKFREALKLIIFQKIFDNDLIPEIIYFKAIDPEAFKLIRLRPNFWTEARSKLFDERARENVWPWLNEGFLLKILSIPEPEITECGIEPKRSFKTKPVKPAQKKF